MVYALRMQHERMTGSFVPSLREYAAQYQINARRLGAGQLLMHPGPVNRGVELSAEVIDSPQALITEQVQSGVVVRMAVLYELLAGAPPHRGPDPAGAPARMSPILDRAPVEPATVLVREAHLLDPRAGLDGPGDLLIRDGQIAALGEPGTLEAPEGGEVVEAPGPARVPGLRGPARAPAHAGPGVQGGHRDRHPRRRRRRLLRDPGDAQHQPGGGQRVDRAVAARDRRGQARVPTGFTAAVTVGQRGEHLTEAAELAAAGAAG